VNDQGNPDLTGNFLGWSLQLWGESIDHSKARLYDLPAATMSLPDPPHPSSTYHMPSSSKTKFLPKPTVYPPQEPSSAEGESHEATFPQGDVDTAAASPSTSSSANESYFSHISELLKSVRSKWLFGAVAITILFAGGVGFFLWRRRIRRRTRGDYTAVPGDSLGMSALESGGLFSRAGRNSRELHDAFGEASDDEADEGAALVGSQPEGFHSGFLQDEEEEGAEKAYRDHPEDLGEGQVAGDVSPPS